ncbi:glycerophosphodiester phosphodiesterase family protein [Besnoitia besnoiti]|uniref:Glycerophosphodiester phosphodiesterase family protein n=1 Tax=Besnoitia besnoiti TaxID=94643 RepID=A0A2A9MKJ7_BESBE|nr:glycerophosphodiester phosphodiesterase family protein [Besnoitia besnoiti]PFH37744.1 glycerophosphodiester phosphodiesterase family protein [Besnoitia besnoiti]
MESLSETAAAAAPLNEFPSSRGRRRVAVDIGSILRRTRNGPCRRLRCRLSMLAWNFLSTPSSKGLRETFSCFRRTRLSPDPSTPLRSTAARDDEENVTLVAATPDHPRPSGDDASPESVHACTYYRVTEGSGSQLSLYLAFVGSILGCCLAYLVLYLLCVWRNDWQSIDATFYTISGKHWAWARILCALFFFVWFYSNLMTMSCALACSPPPCWRRSRRAAALTSAASPSAHPPDVSRVALVPSISPVHLFLLPLAVGGSAAFLLITFLVWGPEYRGVHLWLEFYGPFLYAVSLPLVTLLLAGAVVHFVFSSELSSGSCGGVASGAAGSPAPATATAAGCLPASFLAVSASAASSALDTEPRESLQRQSFSLSSPLLAASRSSSSSNDLSHGSRDDRVHTSASADTAGRGDVENLKGRSGGQRACGEICAAEAAAKSLNSTRLRPSATPGSREEAAGGERVSAAGRRRCSSARVWQSLLCHLPQAVGLLFLFGVWVFLLAAPFLLPSLFSSPCLLRGPPVSSDVNAERRNKFARANASDDRLPPFRRHDLHAWLPEKPLLVGHRGLPELRPENTEVSFEAAAAVGCDGLESDVVVSADGVPFLLHDETFARTTNVGEVFPSRTNTRADLFTWVDVQQLNAGDWWVKTDPYGTVDLVDPVVMKDISEQKVPKLEWLMEKAVTANRSLIYDLRCPDCHSNTWGCGDKCIDLTIDLVRKTRSSRYLWWLQGKRLEMKKEFPDITIVTAADRHFQHDDDNLTDILNVEWVELDAQLTRTWNEKGYWVNSYVVSQPWLLSYFWCAGVGSVTTNSCHRLKAMDAPVYVLSWSAFLWCSAIWDLFCIFLLVCLLYLCVYGASDCPGSLTTVAPAELIMTPDANEGE